MKNIYIVRHCATMINDQDRLQGSWIDCPLSETGKMQAKSLGEKVRLYLDGDKFNFVIVSNTFRTNETADFIDNEAKRIIDSRIIVYDIGTADALKKEEAYTFKGFPIPGIYKKMENPIKYYKRVKSFFEDIKNNSIYDNKNVLVVTHEDITALANHFLEGMPLLESLKTGLGNGEFKVFCLENTNEKEYDSERI